MSEDDIDTVMNKLLQAERELKDAKAEIKRLNSEVSKAQARAQIAVEAMAVGALPNSLVDIDNRAIAAGWAMEDGRPKLPNSNIGPAEWVRNLQTSAKHFFTQPGDTDAPSQPGPKNSGVQQAIPTGRANPWSKEGWHETAQARIYNEQGRDRAEAMAKAAGSYFGALKPA
jgi:hypothetical protein